MKNEITIRKTKGKPNHIDHYVGRRLRTRRTLLGLSQEKLANAIGLTFQQVQKYERGTNRISASRLYQFSKILDVPVTYFFDGVEETETLEKKCKTMPQAILNGGIEKEIPELVRIYSRIMGKSNRKQAIKILKVLASPTSATEAKMEEGIAMPSSAKLIDIDMARTKSPMNREKELAA